MTTSLRYQPGKLSFAEFHKLDMECFPQEPALQDEFEKIVQQDFWAAYDETGLVGFCHTNRTPDQYWISRLCVECSHRRQGIGSQLLQVAIDHARKAGMPGLLLYVQSDNLAAIQLYQRHGFETKGSAYQFLLADPHRILNLPTTRKITAVPLVEVEPSVWPTFPKEWQDIARLHKPPEQYVLLFRDPGGKTTGYCRFDPNFPGCFPFILEEPSLNLVLVLRALQEYTIPGKEALKLTFSSEELAETCRQLGFILNYQLFKMVRSGDIPD